MVDEAAEGGVHISGGHGAHQVKAHVDQLHVIQRGAHSLQHLAHRHLAEAGAGVADGLADQVLRGLDVFLRQGTDDADGLLDHSSQHLHRHVLIGLGDDGVLLIVEADIRPARRRHGQGIAGVRGEQDIHLQALLRKVALLLRLVEESMDGVGIPVQHHVDGLQLSVVLPVRRVPASAGGAAGEQQKRRQQQRKFLFHHQSSFLYKLDPGDSCGARPAGFRTLPSSGRTAFPAGSQWPPPGWPPRTAAQ